MLIALIAGIVTFILTIIGIPAFIRFYHKARITGQQMHEDVKQHQAKAGTPTMGGTVFLLTSVLASFVIGSVFASAVQRPHHDSFYLGPVWRCRLFG